MQEDGQYYFQKLIMVIKDEGEFRIIFHKDLIEMNHKSVSDFNIDRLKNYRFGLIKYSANDYDISNKGILVA